MKHLFLFTLFITTYAIQAQNVSENDVIALLPFKTSQYACIQAAELADAAVHEIFSKSQQVKIVERTAFAHLENEKWRQSEEDFLDGETVSKSKSRGANKIMIAQVIQCDIKRTKIPLAGQVYCSILKVFIRIIDVETSDVVLSETWEVNGGVIPSHYSTSRETAIGSATKGLQKDAKTFLDKYWPIKGGIVEVMSDGKLIINLGTDSGVKPNDSFSVFTSKMVGTPPSVFESVLGSIRISEVNGPNLSTAKLTKGKKEIKSALQSGVQLYIKSK